ncbi:hypothetical protein BRARA_A01391 [Brassica rapa]|uniref:BnaA01g13490D protein n=8 Tax=Brassiceae TaxID=981071 RepID=A0A078ICN1_BRANA|nr:uncharacterized protein LOC103861489 [Brassica rapa]XP_013639483.1 PREDICTED: uncharacterized protein LOC106344708 [Brassica oleracea var. oleracea]XP_013669923.2 uncharacterized protein LOC106374446 [Brassica napus]XP_018470096.1 uncharacterized protein LOC108841824 [Raphanus sativus]XP_022550424.2 uncharacterized protein LOC111202218 [Brassica napus]KAF2544609.1 hypothetical protein F2Q68_00029978 [Brassica cretica]KAG2248778.1 hypothetical protein Bca52824_088406 [Brassica carinata]KAG
MGNCLNGGSNLKRMVQEEEKEVKKDYNRKDRKVKIVLRRDELEKLILFQLNAGGDVQGKGETTLASFGDFLRELEAERFAGEAAAKAAEEEEESRRRCRKWRPSLDRIIEWPEETLA